MEEKLARFLLDFTAGHALDNSQTRATLALTHGEIAEIIGSSRETVTRLFADFKRKRTRRMQRRAFSSSLKCAMLHSRAL